MSYTALYRKFRPTEFEDVKGQDHIVTTLKNQIKADRIGHAYLFCGTRGTGKTTIAKIFAKAVNCENPVDGSPCGECRMCKAIASGGSMNVIEIDAASNNGVDNIREIREEVSYSPAEGRFKVYIIDEVHMLSTGAFNALLKTLEEPPAYVIFVLATTEAHKIPVTILSRCQRYDFHRITTGTIADRLKELLQVEGVEAEDRAIEYVAKAGDGSMRDALSLLDQCIAFHLGQKLTYEKVLDVLGAVDTEVFSRFTGLILKDDISGVIHMLDDLIREGRELGQFVTDFTWYLRNLLLAKTSDDLEGVLDMSSDNLRRVQEDAKHISIEMLMRGIRIFSDLSNQMRFATQKRVLLEMTIIRFCRPQMERNDDSVLARISKIEEDLKSGNYAAAPVQTTPGQGNAAPVRTAPVKKEIPKAIPEDVKKVVAGWKGLIRGLSPMSQNYLKHARLSLGGENMLQIVFEDATAYEFMNREAQRKDLEALIANTFGKAVELDIRATESGRSFDETFVDLEKLVTMDIEIED